MPEDTHQPYNPEQSRLGDEDFAGNLALERAYISGALSAISGKKGDLTEFDRARQEILNLRLARIERELATVRERSPQPTPEKSAATDEPTIIEPLVVESAGRSEEKPGSTATILEPLPVEGRAARRVSGIGSESQLTLTEKLRLIELIKKGCGDIKSLGKDAVETALGFVELVLEDPAERADALEDLLGMRFMDKTVLGDHLIIPPKDREEYLRLRAKLPSYKREKA